MERLWCVNNEVAMPMTGSAGLKSHDHRQTLWKAGYSVLEVQSYTSV